MRILMVFVLLCGGISQTAASVQVSLSASDSTWMVQTGGSMVGYTDVYMTVRYDDVAPSANYVLLLDFIDGLERTGNAGFGFTSTPVWADLSDAWFPQPVGVTPIEWISIDAYPGGHGLTLTLPGYFLQGTDWPVGEITKPLLRINYLLDHSVDTTFSLDWRITGYLAFSGPAGGAGSAGPFEASAMSQITALVDPGPVPEPLSVIVWGTLGAVALALPSRRR